MLDDKCLFLVGVNLKLGKKTIDGERVYIVFEAGPTHFGLKSAFKLIEQAAKAKADAIKFQLCDHNRLITSKDVKFSYDILLDKKKNLSKTIEEPLIDIWQRRYLPKKDWKKLKEKCNEVGIDFFATVFFAEDINLLNSIGVNSFKIASQDIKYEELIKECARTKLPIQIDTGNATISDIEIAVEWIRSQKNEKIIINHCPSGYPARFESVNLNIIKTLKNMFDYPIAFSDHSIGWEMDIAARCFGADIVEKTITLDRTIKSCEHIMSLEYEDMKKFVKSMRNLDIAIGSHRKIITKSESKKQLNVTRSAYLIKNVKKNAKIRRSDFDFRRPGNGLIKPHNLEYFIGRKYSRDVNAGQFLLKNHVV